MIECSICCEVITFNSTEEDVRATNCGHVFHDGCLKGWLSRSGTGSGTCPQCRTALRETDSIRLYMNSQRGPNAEEKLSKDEIKRLTQLKGTIQKAIVSMERLYSEVDRISAAKTSGKDAIKLCANIRMKLLQGHDASHAGAGDESSEVNLKKTEKKISDALGHIAVFEEKMFLTNKSLTDMAAQLQISGSGDRNKYSTSFAKSFSNVGNSKRNFY